METLEVVVGQRVTVDADENGWPYRLIVGGDEAGAMPERYQDRRGATKVRVSRTVPELAPGRYDLILRDRGGDQRAAVLLVT